MGRETTDGETREISTTDRETRQRDWRERRRQREIRGRFKERKNWGDWEMLLLLMMMMMVMMIFWELSWDRQTAKRKFWGVVAEEELRKRRQKHGMHTELELLQRQSTRTPQGAMSTRAQPLGSWSKPKLQYHLLPRRRRRPSCWIPRYSSHALCVHACVRACVCDTSSFQLREGFESK